ncbi:hypothetical protein OC845_001688 [Tilletia horrida]|nr:hypothetical protein OC845_001688 [Tilletia horrida]
MPPFTRQEQRQSLRADNAGVTERALQQMLEDFDNYRRMMTTQNKDIIKTNMFGQQRIRHLESQVTALEEKITIQAAAKTKAEARSMQLEHELACIRIAFEFLSNTVTGNHRHTQSTSRDDFFQRVMPQPPPLPAAPVHGKSNLVKPLATEVPATITKNVSRPPSYSLGIVKEEHPSDQSPPSSPERNPRSHFVFGSHLGDVDESAANLYPPLPSPTPTDNSSAPSPVRTPDLDFPIALPLNLHGQGSGPLAGLNIHIETIEGQEQNFFQRVQIFNRPHLTRSDSASWSVNTPVQASPELPQEAEIVSQPASNCNSGTQVQASNRVTVRKRKHRDASEDVQPDRRQALSDTSNLQRSPEKGAGSPLSGKSKSSSVSVMSNTGRTSNRFDHVDTPLLRPSLRLDDENRESVQSEEEYLEKDRFATVPTGRKRKTTSSITRPVQMRSRSEDSCVCGKGLNVCNQTGTKQHSGGCKCLPCTCSDLHSPTGTSGASEPGSATPRGQHLPLQVQQSRSFEQVQSTAKALATITQQDPDENDIDKSDLKLKNLQDNEHEDTSEAESGRPTRRARSSVNYALPKLNTKMRKPDSTSTASEPSSRPSTTPRPSESASLSEKTAKRTLAATALKTAALTAVAQHKRKSSANSPSLHPEAFPQHQRARSRSSSSDVSIMSFTSGSSGTPILRSPAMAGSAEEKGKWTPSIATSATLSAAAAKLDSAVAMRKQDSEGTEKGEEAINGEAEPDRSGGSTTIVPTETSSSSSSNPPSDPPGPQSAELTSETSAGAGPRPTRRSSAAVNYALPKLNTKMRKPDPENSDAGTRRKSTNATGSRSTKKPGQPSKDTHHPEDESSDGESVTSERRDAGGRESTSAGVSANMAHYSNRTLRKSTIAPVSYALPKLNTKMRKPDEPQPEAGSATTESPKRKMARKAVSSGSLNTSASAESSAVASGPIPIKLTTRSLGRTTGASALAGPSALLPSPSIFAPHSPRTSLHAMLTHPPRERSGSSTSSGSTVRGGNSRMEAVWSSHEEQQEDEDEDEENDDDDDDDEAGLEDDVKEDEDEVQFHASLRADRDDQSSSESENDEDEGGGDADGEGEIDGDWYDDRMDPYRFSSDPPSSAIRGEIKTGSSSLLTAAHADSSVADAESNAAEVSGCAVGSASFDSNLSAYDSTVTYG